MSFEHKPTMKDRERTVWLKDRPDAAVVIEKQRAKLAMTWDELIIPADEAKARAARRFSQEPHHE